MTAMGPLLLLSSEPLRVLPKSLMGTELHRVQSLVEEEEDDLQTEEEDPLMVVVRTLEDPQDPLIDHLTMEEVVAKERNHLI